MSPTAPARAALAPGSSYCTLAEICRRYGPDYAQQHPLSSGQRQALTAIQRCRTAALGGQRWWCAACGYERYVYHSCRNRHCPQCQTLASAAWVQARCADLLPVPYFHNVFTLPHELNPLVLFSVRNQRRLGKLLFTAVAQTLLAFGRQELGGQIGFTLVLHTWDQQLRPHFHLHALIASGALSADGARWIAGGSRFLFPVRGLSRMFRAKYLEGLAALFAKAKLDLPPQLARLAAPAPQRRWLRRLRKKPWVVYSQRPFAGPRKLLEYLGRYTHRVAISNERLLSCADGQVRFTWRDRRDGDRRKQLTLPAEEFLHRFLSHVLPQRFVRIRHYGLLAQRDKQQRLRQIRRLLGAPQSLPEDARPQTAAEWLRALLGLDLDRCPDCGGLLHSEALAPQKEALESSDCRHAFSPWDTS